MPDSTIRDSRPAPDTACGIPWFPPAWCPVHLQPYELIVHHTMDCGGLMCLCTERVHVCRACVHADHLRAMLGRLRLPRPVFLPVRPRVGRIVLEAAP